MSVPLGLDGKPAGRRRELRRLREEITAAGRALKPDRVMEAYLCAERLARTWPEYQPLVARGRRVYWAAVKGRRVP